MKTKSLLTSLLLLLGLGAYTVLNTSYSTGFGGTYLTTGCGTVGCHGNLNTSTTVAINGLPTFYNVNTAYPISVTVTNAAQAAAGFQVRTNIGTLSTVDPQIVIGGGSQSAGHNQRKNMVAGTATFNLVWTSPSTGGTAASFDAAGNAVNFDFSNNGDFWNFAPTNNVPLSVKLLDVSARQVNKSIEIIFSSSNKKDISHYEVQKSIDGNNFSTFTTEQANSSAEYSVTDHGVQSGKNYFYRIIEISRDGAKTLSDVVAVRFISDQNNIAIFPTIINNNVMKIETGSITDNVTLVLYNYAGKKVFTATNVLESVQIPSLAHGFYFATLSVQNQNVLTQKLIIQH